jgi:hypothetical protein
MEGDFTGQAKNTKNMDSRKGAKNAKKSAGICFFNCRGYCIGSLKKQISYLRILRSWRFELSYPLRALRLCVKHTLFRPSVFTWRFKAFRLPKTAASDTADLRKLHQI